MEKYEVFSKVEDRNLTKKRSDVVYKIPFLGCSEVQVGETEQYLEKRISFHRYDLNHLEKESTALAQHKKNTGHDLSYESN